MRKRSIAIFAVAAFITSLGTGVAQAAPSWCDIQEKLGVRNVKECEEPTR